MHAYTFVHTGCVRYFSRRARSASPDTEHRICILVPTIPAPLPMSHVSFHRCPGEAPPPLVPEAQPMVPNLTTFWWWWWWILSTSDLHVASFHLHPDQRPGTEAQTSRVRLHRTLGRLAAISPRYRTLARPSFLLCAYPYCR